MGSTLQNFSHTATKLNIMSENKKSSPRSRRKEAARRSNTISSKNQKPTQKRTSKRVIEELVGTVSMTREGNGFIVVPERDDDVFVPQRKLRVALNNDTVKIGVTKVSGYDKKKAEGEVLEVLERSKRPYIGVLQIIGDQAWVIVESKSKPYDITVSPHKLPKHAQGM